jgi:uncharacterized protein (TIGR01244 family)
MVRTKVMNLLPVAVLAAFAPHISSAQRLTGESPSGQVPAPVALDNRGLFQEKFARVGDDVFIGGQPTERALRELHDQGVTTVVNLRTPEEMARISFDEAALIKGLGMKYVYLPVRGNAEFPYSPEVLKSFADAVSSSKGKVLLHCTVAWRASHLWAAYLIQYRHVPVETALAQARSINLMDDMRMDGERQPVESFLGRSLREVGHGKK